MLTIDPYIALLRQNMLDFLKGVLKQLVDSGAPNFGNSHVAPGVKAAIGAGGELLQGLLKASAAR